MWASAKAGNTRVHSCCCWFQMNKSHRLNVGLFVQSDSDIYKTYYNMNNVFLPREQEHAGLNCIVSVCKIKFSSERVKTQAAAPGLWRRSTTCLPYKERRDSMSHDTRTRTHTLWQSSRSLRRASFRFIPRMNPLRVEMNISGFHHVTHPIGKSDVRFSVRAQTARHHGSQ